jgi:transposase
VVEAVRDGRTWWRSGGLHAQRVCGPYTGSRQSCRVVIDDGRDAAVEARRRELTGSSHGDDGGDVRGE